MKDDFKDDEIDKAAQILNSYDLYGEYSNPMTHFQDYPSIDAARKARVKIRKKILENILSTRPKGIDPKELTKKQTYKTREDL